MRRYPVFSVLTLLVSLLAVSCDSRGSAGLRYDFGDIIDIVLTPDSTVRRAGCFTDAGSWMGFTLPQRDSRINGFCGPFSIEHRLWMAQAAVTVGFAGDEGVMQPDSLTYFPGEVFMSSSSEAGRMEQRMVFADRTTALLAVTGDSDAGFVFAGKGWNSRVRLGMRENTVVAEHPSGETVLLTFSPGTEVSCSGDNYSARTAEGCRNTWVAVSFCYEGDDVEAVRQGAVAMLGDPEQVVEANSARWEGYLSRVLRDDMPHEYDRVAVKSVVTLMSNWRAARGDLLHEGVIPSHSVTYFTGFWAWDSWRFSAALARFAPELARNNIRAMFDYQQPDGMVIDCIYTDSRWNNARDSKPPLACWAVDEIFTYNQDTAFVREMYPKLLSYYKWWFAKRDHNGNGMCEFGSTDGTLEAAGWESGMDNAIRFDGASMLRNGPDAWSLDQESVDLNAYLAFEARLLRKFAALIGEEFDAPDYSADVADYFFDEEIGYFCDRKIADGSFIAEPACEGYTPFWVRIASDEQMARALKLLTDTSKFSTYIPFPTAAADNPKCSPDGYWRGPIWLDQTYQAIRGLRNYGYGDLADEYTRQVFDRCDGLTGDAPIHENYGTHTGERLQASHFSWSASHLLMMYEDYGK